MNDGSVGGAHSWPWRPAAPSPQPPPPPAARPGPAPRRRSASSASPQPMRRAAAARRGPARSRPARCRRCRPAEQRQRVRQCQTAGRIHGQGARTAAQGSVIGGRTGGGAGDCGARLCWGWCGRLLPVRKAVSCLPLSRGGGGGGGGGSAAAGVGGGAGVGAAGLEGVSCGGPVACLPAAGRSCRRVASWPASPRPGDGRPALTPLAPESRGVLGGWCWRHASTARAQAAPRSRGWHRRRQRRAARRITGHWRARAR